MSIFVSGNYAYVAESYGGLRIIDVSNPSAPFEAGFFNMGITAKGVAVSGNYAYVAGSSAGLRIIDVSSPALPLEAGYWDTGGSAQGVCVLGSYAYVADYNCGLQIIRNDLFVSGIGTENVQSRETVHSDAYPNPFNPQTKIAFEIPIQESVTLRVFDMAGRLVKESITAEPHNPGRHEVIWKGRDDIGRRVASGTYFYRLEAGEYSETKLTGRSLLRGDRKPSGTAATTPAP